MSTNVVRKPIFVRKYCPQKKIKKSFHKKYYSPDTATYLRRIEEEKRARQQGATQDNRSFLQKYWIYFVPVIAFMVCICCIILAVLLLIWLINQINEDMIEHAFMYENNEEENF